MLRRATGGVVDDLIAYLVGDDEVFLVPNAANTAEVVRRLRGRGAGRASTVTDQHRDFGVLAVQGPRSADVLDAARAAAPTRTTWPTPTPSWHGRAGAVCRTGYTGEHGYELLPPAGPTPARCGTRCSRPARDLGGQPCRARRPRHAAHRDGLPAARPGPVAGDHAGAGPLRLGGRLEEGRVLGPRRAAGRAGSAGRARLLWGLEALDRGIPRAAHGGARRRRRRRSARSPAGRSRRPCGTASGWRCSSTAPASARATRSRVDVRGRPAPVARRQAAVRASARPLTRRISVAPRESRLGA